MSLPPTCTPADPPWNPSRRLGHTAGIEECLILAVGNLTARRRKEDHATMPRNSSVSDSRESIRTLLSSIEHASPLSEATLPWQRVQYAAVTFLSAVVIWAPRLRDLISPPS